MSRANNASDIDCMKACRIGAPAPCASTYSARALAGTMSSPSTVPLPGTTNDGSVIRIGDMRSLQVERFGGTVREYPGVEATITAPAAPHGFCPRRGYEIG